MTGKKILSVSVLFVFLLSSCAGTKAIFRFDERLPLEQTALIAVLTGGFALTSYNGIKLETYNVLGMPSQKRPYMSLPAGRIEFLADARRDVQRGKTIYVEKGTDLYFEYNFEAGKQYLITFAIVNDTWGAGIYEKLWYNAENDIISVSSPNPFSKPDIFVPFRTLK